MRIVFLLPSYAPSPIGGYQVVYRYASALAAKHNRVTIVHSGAYGGAGSPRRSLAKAVRDLRYLPEVLTNARPPWEHLHPDVEIVNHYSRRHGALPDADVYIASAARTAFASHRAALTAGARSVMFVQHDESWDVGESISRAAWSLGSEKIAIAPWLCAALLELGQPSSLIPNWISPGEFPPGLPISDRPLRIVTMLSPMRFKRQDLLIEVYKSLAEAHPEIELVSFGVAAQPPELQEISHHYRKPSRKALGELFRSSRVYLCGSDAEGWHLPAAEAMSSGCALVTTACPGVLGYAEGVSRVVPIGDSAGLVNEVLDLLSDEFACSEIAEAGRLRISTFTFEDSLRLFERAINSA